MIFGIPREIRAQENRVGALPFVVKEIVRRGHQVYVEADAGESCEAPDSQYEQVGATVVPSAEKLYSASDIILKVREPKPVEYELIKPDQVLLSFFHFLESAERIKAIASRGCTCLAYELIKDSSEYPSLLLPISRIAGQIALINGAYFLQKQNMGRGVVLGQITGSAPANILILGAGNVGREAAISAANLGAKITVLDSDPKKLDLVEKLGFKNISTQISSADRLQQLLPQTDLLVTAVQIPNHPTPKLVTADMVKSMRRGSVIVMVDIDQGGSVETGKITNHDNPTFVVDGVVHYCVSNITAGVPIAASQALSTALLPLVIQIAENGLEQAILKDQRLAGSIAIYKGHIVKPYLAEVAGLPAANLAEKIQELNSVN